MEQNKEKALKNETWRVIGFMFACCLAPVLFIGITGAWFSSLSGQETVSFIFFVVTLIFIGFGFRKLYFSSHCCQEEQDNVSNVVLQKQRLIFWLASVSVLILWFFLW